MFVSSNTKKTVWEITNKTQKNVHDTFGWKVRNNIAERDHRPSAKKVINKLLSSMEIDEIDESTTRNTSTTESVKYWSRARRWRVGEWLPKGLEEGGMLSRGSGRGARKKKYGLRGIPNH